MHRWIGTYLASILLVTGPALASAQGAVQPSPVEAFFRFPELSSVKLSPDGRRFAMIVKSKEGRLALASCDATDLKKCQFVLRGDDADVTNYFWVNDNRLFVSTGDTQERNDRNDGYWYAADADGSNVREFRAPGRFQIIGPTHDGSNDILVSRLTLTNADYAVRNVQPYRWNTTTGSLTEILHLNNPAESRGWVFDRQDRPRVMYAVNGLNETVYFLNKEETQWQKIASFDMLAGQAMTPTMFGFDDTLYVSVRSSGDQTALYKYDVGSAKLAASPSVDFPGFDYHASTESDYKARKILGFHYETDTLGTVWVDVHMKEIQAKIDALLPATVNTITCTSCLSNRYMIVTAASDKQPPVFLIYDTESAQMQRIGASRPLIHAAQMGQRDFSRFKARDGLEIPVYVTTPAGWHNGALPTVVLVHGGPWVRGASWEWEDQAQFLASRGYAVIEPQFRGTTGYGMKLWSKSFKQWGLSMQDDLADSAKWAIERGYADPKRVAIAGASYGGYATLMGLIKNPELFKCGFEWVGVTDVRLMFSEVWNDASIEQLNFGMKSMIGDPDSDAKQLAETSPIERASELHQPILMAYGGQDRRVPMAQGLAFEDAVRATNKNVEFLSYPDEGHGWVREPDNVDFWNHVASFLDKNLKVLQ